jgi:hypothetical protein
MRQITLPIRGCHPLWPAFPDRSCHAHCSADPRSLATTSGVSVDFLSSGYLDVSIPRVCSFNPMYSGKKYLITHPDNHFAEPPPNRPGAGAERLLRSNNRIYSSGLPHSEIHGSKVILTSPWLIAEYHVLHRLLLPRHPPNALFALDLIQKKQERESIATFHMTGPLCSRLLLATHPCCGPSWSKVIHFPSGRWFTTGHVWLVYLTWNKTAFQRRLRSTEVPPHAEEPAVLMFLSLYDVKPSLKIRHSRASEEEALESRIRFSMLLAAAPLRADPWPVGMSCFECCLQQHRADP